MSKIVIDGKEYSGIFEEGIKKVKHIWRTKKGDKKNIIFGFTTQKAMRKWAQKEGLLELCDKGIEANRRIKEWLKTPLTRDEEEELRKWQVRLINLRRGRLVYALKMKKIKPHEIKKIEELTRDYDPLRGPVLGSVILYDRTRYRSPWRYLPPGYYPKFSWFGFNDRTESVFPIPSPQLVILCQHTWFRGYWKYYWYPTPDLGWFRNRASSAIVY